MSYLSPQADEIVSDNSRQPTDLLRDNWTATFGSNATEQYVQGQPWLLRQPPRLRVKPRN